MRQRCLRPITSNTFGIGLRNEHLQELCQSPVNAGIDFLELAPDNWMGIGGFKRQCLEQLAEKYPLVAHGLSLSIGDPQPLNLDYVQKVRDFLDSYEIALYSDHLCFSRDENGYLYDLLPIPKRRENIDYLADRIYQVQEIIKRPLILENITYYHRYQGEMSDAEFIAELIKASGCKLLLDINNLYINSQNHHGNPLDILNAVNSDDIAYYHIAGHLDSGDGPIIDIHGKTTAKAVIDLAREVVKIHGMKPMLLERDNNIPPLAVLTDELCTIKSDLSH